MSLRHLVILVILFQYSILKAAKVSPFLKKDGLGLNLQDLKFPETLSADLLSGLKNEILFQFDLSAGPNFQLHKSAHLIMKYDLWNEKFTMTMFVGDKIQETNVVPNIKQVLLSLSNLKFFNLWNRNELSKEAQMRIHVDVLLNPIEKEQMEKIQKWVIKNSVTLPLDATGLNSGKPVAAGKTSTLFNMIFAQYSSGSIFAATWRDTVSSQSFRLFEVQNEK